MDKSNFEDNLGQMKIFIFMRALYAWYSFEIKSEYNISVMIKFHSLKICLHGEFLVLY